MGKGREGKRKGNISGTASANNKGNCQLNVCY